MDVNRRKYIGPHVVEEFIWNGGFIVYVDNHLVKEGFDDAVSRLESEAFDKAFEHPAHEPDDDTPYVGEDAERADTAYDQWLHDMGQGA